MNESPILAKEFLEKIKDNEKLIRAKQAERQYWEELATSATSNISGVRVKSSTDGTIMQTQASEIVLIDEEIAWLKADISYRIGILKKLRPSEGLFLHQMYVLHTPLKALCVNERKSYSWGKHMHKVCLEHLQEILDKSFKKVHDCT